MATTMIRVLAALLLVVIYSLPVEAQYRRGSNGPKNNPGGLANEPAASFHGILKKVDGSKIYLELADGNMMEFRATRKSTYMVAGKPAKLKDLVEGRLAEIEGRHAPGAIEAVTVTIKDK
jgi:hypothetical protein